MPAILVPSCATAACHSSATARKDVVLDTIEGACEIYVLDFLRGEGFGGVRMPLDSPLPDADILLIEEWELPTPKLGCP